LKGNAMPKPLIGLTTYNSKNQYGYPITALMDRYITTVSEAGGIPVMIPNGLTDDECRSLLQRLDGLVLTGGGDIGIELYHAEPHLHVEVVDPSRDATESGLIRAVVQSDKPFLGICRGLQMINVALGGTLYTHIADQFPGALKHDHDSGTERQFLAHAVNIVKDCNMADFLGENQLLVNSLHHQGVKQLAVGLIPVAYATDGLVEGIELADHPFGIGVQWHPEWLTDQSATQNLFKAFIREASRE
jgi:putative glutamine amidotransferase